MRDDRRFGSADPPAYIYSPDRSWLACASENLHPNFVIL